MLNNQKDFQSIVAHCRHRGIIFQGSEIYGGLANSWDYGPLGALMLNHVKAAWWRKFVRECPHNVGLDSSILMNPAVWVASGHVSTFNDPLTDCRECKERFRADKLVSDFLTAKNGRETSADGWTYEKLEETIKEQSIPCPSCAKSNFTPVRQFNGMFKTHQGVSEESATAIYLRPETAQGIFVQYKNIQRAMRRKIPFGVGQIGKSFRNEITPGNFIFRTREFEQMELEFFCEPGTDLEWFAYWRQFCHDWLLNLGIRPESLRLRDHSPEELSHYSKATTDFEFAFPFGWGELWGIADRTDFDLKAHAEHSGENMEYVDPTNGNKFVPYVIEPSLGANRMLLAFLCDAYDSETLEDGETRVVLRLHPAIAPYQAAVLPLQKKLGETARQLWQALAAAGLDVDYDEAGSIGKRYRRQDEVGTPYCVTVDFDTLESGKVTIRDRDSMEQVTLPMEEVAQYIQGKMEF
ncbi:MAG: glycine--tRNA ligase [Clostridia bacterium]|nr:glycine--tRNA ligase [Clostridia bacterium]